MTETYKGLLEKEKASILKMGSVIEDAPYLLDGKSDQTMNTRGQTCNCASCASSGGTCRAVPTGIETQI